ncbi:MAG TPA: hypothetical protein VIT85_02055 [Solirubrobacterales bacterium]
MKREMKGARRHLTYANVLATVTAFVVLFGGAAYAANQLAKNSVGAKQLKKNAVTTAKIKKNAVTTAKLKKGAVTGAKVKGGSLGVADLSLPSMPFGRVVHRASWSGSVQGGGPGTPTLVTTTSYTQEAGSDDIYSGSVEVSPPPLTCEPPRALVANLYIDTPDLATALGENQVANGLFFDMKGNRSFPSRITLAPTAGGVRFQPGSPTPHTLSLFVTAVCKLSEPGIIVTGATIEVAGVK